MSENEATEVASEPRVRVTQEAAQFAKKKREQLGQPNAALRLGVRGGGCAGLTYVMDFTEEAPRERDLVYEVEGLSVYVDKRSLPYIEGATLAYENTLMHQGFKWENPLQESACGCGSTFSVKADVAKAKKTLKTA